AARSRSRGAEPGARERKRQRKGGGAMKSLGLLGLTALGLMAATGAGCTVVAPGNPDAGMTMIIPTPIRPDALPMPQPLEASVLVVANLDRWAGNLADQTRPAMPGL